MPSAVRDEAWGGEVEANAPGRGSGSNGTDFYGLGLIIKRIVQWPEFTLGTGSLRRETLPILGLTVGVISV